MTDNTVVKPHPAKFHPDVLATVREILDSHHANPFSSGRHVQHIMDPFAGVGGIHELHDPDNGRYTYGLELEPEWAEQHDRTMVGDVLKLAVIDPEYPGWEWPVGGTMVNWVVTSPCYGNRMADTYTDHTRRHTYTAYLGREPSEGSSATMQWGPQYRTFHVAAWDAIRRRLVKGGNLVVNLKDHYRTRHSSRYVGGKYQERQRVTDWHLEVLQGLGFTLVGRRKIQLGGIRHGQNGRARIDYEEVAWLAS